MKVVFLSLNLFLFIPYTNYIYKHQLNSVDFAKKNGASDISRKKSKISWDFQGQIRGKIGRFRGIFTGKKSRNSQKKKK